MVNRLRRHLLFCVSVLVLAPPIHQAEARDGERGFYAGLALLYPVPRDSELTWETDSGLKLAADITGSSAPAALGTLGYGFGNGIRGELEVGSRQIGFDQLKGTLSGTGVNGTVPFAPKIDRGLDSLTLMVNGFYDFQVWQARPYVGGGVGLARQELEFTADPVRVEGGPGNGQTTLDVQARLSEGDTVLAYQAMAGVGYPVSDRAVIHAGYRYFATGESDFRNIKVIYGAIHNFEFGIRYRF